MTTLDDALAAIQKIHDNGMALADPGRAKWEAEMAFKRLLVSTLNSLSGGTASAPAVSAAPVDTTALDTAVAEVNAIHEKATALTAQLQADLAALGKFATSLQAPATNTAGPAAPSVVADGTPSASESASTASEGAPSAPAAPTSSAAPTLAPSNANIS
jgi:hypothetical protein